jgi:hypothetical protein
MLLIRKTNKTSFWNKRIKLVYIIFSGAETNAIQNQLFSSRKKERVG